MGITVMGIDPGQAGAIALLREGGGVEHWKMPATERDLLYLLLDHVSAGMLADPVVYLEQVGPMPKQGVSSTWKFAQHYGSLRMAVMAVGFQLNLVTPQKWQKEMGCRSHGDKNVTKAKAQQLFPAIKVTHANADALLIAAYGYRQITGVSWSG